MRDVARWRLEAVVFKEGTPEEAATLWKVARLKRFLFLLGTGKATASELRRTGGTMIMYGMDCVQNPKITAHMGGLWW